MSGFEIAQTRISTWQPNQPLDLSDLGLISLPEIPIGVVILNCRGNDIEELPENLQVSELFCDSNRIKYIPQLENCRILECSYQRTKSQLHFHSDYPHLQELYCSNNNIAQLPECGKLQILVCNDNQLINIPIYPDLQTLSCANNNITSIADMKNIIELFCYYNQITRIPTSPYIRLNCSKNFITKLPELLQVEELICDHNKLTILPDVPRATNINCSYNQITKIENIENVTVFDCAYNKIKKLPTLKYVVELDCRNNKLESLPDLPEARYVDAGDNKITKLRELSNVEKLNISYNRVRKIPENLNHLQELYANDNPITSIPSYLRTLPQLETVQLTLENITDQTQYINWDAISIDKYQQDYEDVDEKYYEFSRNTLRTQRNRAKRASDSTISTMSTYSNQSEQLEEIPETEIGGICTSNQHITNHTTIVYHHDYSECYHENQLLTTWQQQTPCYIKSTLKQIYKLPYREVWVDHIAYWLLQSYTALMLNPIEQITTSQDEQVMLFTCVPIHIESWQQGNPTHDAQPWHPHREDYNSTFINIESPDYVEHATHITDGRNTILFAGKNMRLTWSQQNTILFQGTTQAIYVGELDDVQRSGFGTMTWIHQGKPDMTYVGEWQDDNMDGHGTYTGSWRQGEIDAL